MACLLLFGHGRARQRVEAALALGAALFPARVRGLIAEWVELITYGIVVIWSDALSRRIEVCVRELGRWWEKMMLRVD